VLLKPTSERGSQVIVQGRVCGMCLSRDFDRDSLREKVRRSFLRLKPHLRTDCFGRSRRRSRDQSQRPGFVNFAMAEIGRRPVFLVGDIDRGGVFAALDWHDGTPRATGEGTVKGFYHQTSFVVRKTLLEPGCVSLEERTGKPVLGCLPYLRDLGLEAEDSVSGNVIATGSGLFSATVNVAVVCLPYRELNRFSPSCPVSAVTSTMCNSRRKLRS